MTQQQNIRNETKEQIMKYPMLAITFCAVTAFVVACKQSEDQSTAMQLDKIKTETRADAQDMKDYVFAQRADYAAKMQGQLDALNKDLDQLSVKIENSSDAVKADAKPKLKALRDHAAQLNVQLADAKNATASTWDDVKVSSEKAYDSLKDDFQSARQWASDKIAP
jgi:biopolymer transport protein ExbD